MKARNTISRIAGVLAIVAGLLILASGVAAHGFLLSVLALINANISGYLPTPARQISETTVDVLTIIISLGGFTVIIGGIAMLNRRLFTGRLLVALGGGAGFLGLTITLAYSVLTHGLPSILDYPEYWVGVILAAIARSLAKGK